MDYKNIELKKQTQNLTSNEILEILDKPDSVDYLNKKINSALDSPDILKRKKEFSELKKEIIISSIKGGKENAELYLKFRSIVANEDYFRLEHIDKLGLEYDILLFLSKKGIGKSYYMINQINKWTEDGKGIAVVFRLNDEDLPAFAQQIDDYGGDFTMDGKGRLYSRSQFEPDRDKPSKQVPRYIGRACGMMSGSKLKGGAYKGLRGIIMDEATDRRRGLKKEHFETFFKSILNSIERETKNCPFIIFGNTDGYESAHPLFATLGIDPDENLVYIRRQFPGALNETKILYINSRGLYRKGAEHSKMIGAIADVHQVISAFVNESINKTRKVCSLDLTVLTDPVFAILFTDIEQKKMLIKLSKYETKDHLNNDITAFFICVESYDPMYTYNFNTFTSEEVLRSLYSDHVYFVEDLSDYWDDISNILMTDYCFFIGGETETILTKYLKQFAKSRTRIS